jgi:NifU-like protein involved in Fe-S cluster formation
VNYNFLTARHFENPVHAGVLTGAGVRRGTAGGRTQGIWVQFDVQVHEAPDQPAAIADVRFLAFACPHVIAIADYVAQAAVGKPAAAALPETIDALRRRFELPVEKLGRLLLIEDAWIRAVSPPYPRDARSA